MIEFSDRCSIYPTFACIVSHLAGISSFHAKHISSGVLSYVSSLSFLLFFLLFCLSHPAAISSHPTRHVPSGGHKKTTSSFRRFYVLPHHRCKTRQDQNLNHSKTKPQKFYQFVLIIWGSHSNHWLFVCVHCSRMLFTFPNSFTYLQDIAQGQGLIA